MNKLEQTHLYFWLANCGLTIRRQLDLLDSFGGVEDIYKAFSSGNAELEYALKPVDYNRVRLSTDASFIMRQYNDIVAEGIEIVTLDSEYYPEKLRQREVSASICLYAKGDIRLLTTDTLAVVGTRRCTDYGAKAARMFSSELAKNGLTIVSGLADGIDTIAHEGALSVSGKTIAVLGNGFNKIYPAGNTNLANKIAMEGLLITEYLPDTRAEKHHFPERNRLISGLSRGVLVVEGDEGSGSLITANTALEQGRDLFVIPGRIDSPNSRGTLRLIRSIPHSMVLEPLDILDAFNIKYVFKQKVKPRPQLDILEEAVYNLLKDGEQHINKLIEQTQMDVRTLNRILSDLELKGLITKKQGNIYSV